MAAPRTSSSTLVVVLTVVGVQVFLSVLATHLFSASVVGSESANNRSTNLPTSLYYPPKCSTSEPASTSLAKNQSFGFFDDISDEHWKLAQQHHKALFPNYFNDLHIYSNGPGDKGKIDRLRKSSWWNGENFQVEFICPLARRLPPDSMAE